MITFSFTQQNYHQDVSIKNIIKQYIYSPSAISNNQEQPSTAFSMGYLRNQSVITKKRTINLTGLFRVEQKNFPVHPRNNN